MAIRLLATAILMGASYFAGKAAVRREQAAHDGAQGKTQPEEA